MGTLHIGQVFFTLYQVNTQSLWKTWEHCVVYADLFIVHKQMQHCSFMVKSTDYKYFILPGCAWLWMRECGCNFFPTFYQLWNGVFTGNSFFFFCNLSYKMHQDRILVCGRQNFSRNVQTRKFLRSWFLCASGENHSNKFLRFAPGESHIRLFGEPLYKVLASRPNLTVVDIDPWMSGLQINLAATP